MLRSDLREAAKRAIKTRAKFKIPLDSSFCVIDLAASMGVEVRFVDLKSLDGAFLKDSKTILLSTYRPDGGIRFSCAHEIGHYVFDHGDHFDELVEKVNSAQGRLEEQLGSAFASFLLMPETTLRSAFARRKWDIESATPAQLFTVSSWLGIGYASLLNHLRYGLKIIDQTRFRELVKIRPKTIKSKLCGFDVSTDLSVVDPFWKGRPVDMQVGDYLSANADTVIEKDCLRLVNRSENGIWTAEKPGITKMITDVPENSIVIRVRRREYIGRAAFRHLEED
jgi:Zn-dependent peptidase ImmA (M78 family)